MEDYFNFIRRKSKEGSLIRLTIHGQSFIYEVKDLLRIERTFVKFIDTDGFCRVIPYFSIFYVTEG